MTDQDKLIGKHPDVSHIFGEWLVHTDISGTVSKKHRKLEEINTHRQKAIENISDWIVKHHIIDERIEALRRKSELLHKHEFDQFVDTQNLLPTAELTMKGNIAEIILVEYLKDCTNFTPIIYKLRYNPNVQQSMKGDDVLLFNPKNIFERIYYGESKYRSKPSKKAIQEAVSNLEGSKKLPVSIGFVADRLYEKNETILADQLMEMLSLLKSDSINVNNVGFLLSTKSTTPSSDTFLSVEKHLNTSNPNLVFISLGLINPIEIVQKSFELANKKLLEIK